MKGTEAGENSMYHATWTQLFVSCCNIITDQTGM